MRLALNVMATKVIASDAKTRETHARHTVAFVSLFRNVHAFVAFCGEEISDALVNALIEGEDKLHSATLAKCDKVLHVDGVTQNWFFAVHAIDKGGDVYATRYGRAELRGSIAAIRAAYGAKRVALLSRDDAKKLLASKQAASKDSARLAGLVE